MTDEKQGEDYLELDDEKKKKLKEALDRHLQFLKEAQKNAKPPEKEVKKNSMFGSDEKASKKTESDFPDKDISKKKVEGPKTPPEKIVKKSKFKKRKRSHKEVKMHVETNIDKLYEFVRDKGIVKISKVSKNLGIDSDRVEEWGRILEEHKLVRLHYPPVGEPVFILKKFKSDTTGVEKLKSKKRLKPGRKIFIINLAIILGFIGVVAFYTIRIPTIPTIRIPQIQAYLAVAVIIIIVGAVLALKLTKRRVEGREEKEKKKDRGEKGGGKKG